MVYSEALIRPHILHWLAVVFRVLEAAFSNDAQFGYKLKAKPVSDLKANKLNVIDHDIKVVAIKKY